MTAPNPQAMAAYSNLLNQASNVSQLPFVPYGGQFTAPVNAQRAVGYANQAAQPITGQQIAGFQSPYTQQVVNATEAQFNNQNAQQQQQVLGNAAAQGALGGDRTAVAQANLAGQQQLAEAPSIAALYNAGFNTATNTALAEQQMLGNAAYALGNLGVAGQNAALTGANAQLGYGTLQQGTQQAQDTALYNQFLAQQGYPFQTAQWQAGIDTGVGSQMGGTSLGQTTGPAPNPFSTYGGLALAGLSLLNRGGRIERDNGGRVRGFALGGMPYAGGSSYIPTMGITMGSGAPKPPGSSGPATQQVDPIKQATSIMDMEKKLQGLGNSSTFGGVNYGLGDWGGGASGSDFASAAQAGVAGGLSFDPMTGSVFRRGGRVAGFDFGGGIRHFDDGGGLATDLGLNDIGPAPSFDDRFNAATDYGSRNAIAVTPSPGIVPASSSLSGQLGFGDIPAVAAADTGSANYFGAPTTGLAGAGPSTPLWNDLTSAPVSRVASGPIAGFASPTPPAASVGAVDTVAGLAPRQPNAYAASPVMVGNRSDALSYGAGPVSIDRAKRAIGTFESGNNYESVGPQTHLGRALGRYQVMEKELPRQLKQAGLPPMTPHEFLRDPEAQDKLFENAFGGLMNKYGNFNDTASMWFSGRPAAEAGNRRDVLGTTVPQYLANTNAILARDDGQNPRYGAGASRLADMSNSGGPLRSFAPAPELGTRVADSSGKQSGFGSLFGNPLNLSPNMRGALLAAGFGMLASRSPYLGNAIGEGGLAGISAYAGAQKGDIEQTKTKVSIEDARAKLEQHADESAKKLALDTKRLQQQEEHQQFLEKQAEAGKVPLGYERVEGGLKALPGGPADPDTIKKLGEAKKAATGETSFDDNTMTKMADQYLAGDKGVLVNLGRGAQGATDLKALRRRIVERMDEQGITPAQQAVKMQEFVGLAAGERALGTRTAQIEMAANEARNMMKPALEAAAAVPRTSFVPVNKLIESWQTGGVSDPAQARFAAANFSLVNTYVRAIAPTGVPPESARNHAMAMLSGAMSHESYKAVVDQMNIEMEAALKSPQQVQEKFREMHGGAGASAGAPAGPGPAAGGGFTGRTATNPQTGQKLRETTSGQWVP